MLTNRTKLMVVIGLLSALLLGIWIGMGIKTMSLQAKNGTQHARKIIVVTIDQSEQQELIDQLRKFADKWGYAIRVAPLDPRGESFSVSMWRADIKVFGYYPNSPGRLDIGFYDTDRMYPVPESHFDEEIIDLKSFISEIPNSTFSVEK